MVKEAEKRVACTGLKPAAVQSHPTGPQSPFLPLSFQRPPCAWRHRAPGDTLRLETPCWQSLLPIPFQSLTPSALHWGLFISAWIPMHCLLLRGPNASVVLLARRRLGVTFHQVKPEETLPPSWEGPGDRVPHRHPGGRWLRTVGWVGPGLGTVWAPFPFLPILPLGGSQPAGSAGAVTKVWAILKRKYRQLY